jgi:hypothetical protein
MRRASGLSWCLFTRGSGRGGGVGAVSRGGPDKGAGAGGGEGPAGGLLALVIMAAGGVEAASPACGLSACGTCDVVNRELPEPHPIEHIQARSCDLPCLRRAFRVAVKRDLGGTAVCSRVGCAGRLGLVHVQTPARRHDSGAAAPGAAACSRCLGRGRCRDSRHGRCLLRADRLQLAGPRAALVVWAAASRLACTHAPQSAAHHRREGSYPLSVPATTSRPALRCCSRS